MKTIRSLLLQAVSVLLLTGTLGLGLVSSVQAQEECSVATLQGDYLLTGRADAPNASHEDPTYPRVFVGVHTFDGAGNMSGFNTQSQGGVIRQRVPVEATYTLDADCTGTITIPAANAEWEIVVTRDGREGEYIRVDQGHIARRSIRKQ